MAINTSDYSRIFANDVLQQKELLAKVQQHPQALTEYLQGWQAIAEKASDIKNLALQDVISLFIDAVGATFKPTSDSVGLTQEHWQLLQEWQQLFSNYIHAPNEQKNALALIKYLNHPLLALGLEPEDEQMLLDGFTPVIGQLTVNEEKNLTEVTEDLALFADDEFPEVILTVETASKESMPDEQDSLESFNAAGEKVPTWQDIEPVFKQALLCLQTAVDSGILNDVKAFKKSSDQYIQYWQTIADLFSQNESFVGLADIVLLFSEILGQTFAEQESLSSDQFALLNDWHTNFSGYCKAPANTQLALNLMTCLKSSFWATPITSDDEMMLLQGLGIDKNSSSALSLSKKQNSDTSASRHPIWQKFTLFFDDVQNQLQVMSELTLPENSQTCHNYLQHYAEQWVVIAEIIAEEPHFQTLADISLLFADNCSDLVTQNIPLTSSHIQLLQNWHNAFDLYLHDIHQVSQASVLISCLENSYWLQPLTAEDKTWLLSSLEEELQEFALVAEKSENLLQFGQDLLAEEHDDFALFAEQLEHEDFSASGLAEHETEDLAMFADEGLFDDFALLADEIKLKETAVVEPAQMEPDSSQKVAESSSLAEEKPIPQAVPVKPELIGMVQDEFALLVQELNTEMSAVTDMQTFKQVLKNHEFKFDNLAKACNTIGLLGLEQVFQHLSLNMHFRREGDIFNKTQLELFKTVLPLIQNYLVAITERDHAVKLVTHLTQSGWNQALAKELAPQWIEMLSGVVFISPEQRLVPRQTIADVGDVSLELPNDVNPELLDSLLNELPVLTGNFLAVIQKIISGNAQVQQLLEAQRIAHTLKGSGNIVGVSGIAVLTHHLEEILEYLSEHKTFPPKALAMVLLEAADCLEMMSELMLNGEKHPPDHALEILQRVLDWANQIATSGLSATDLAIERTTLPAEPSTETAPVLQETKHTETMPMVRVPSETINKLMRMTGEGSILSEQFKERIKYFSESLKTLNDLTWYMHSLVAELDQGINIQSYTAKTARHSVSSDFDALELEQYNELHTSASRISEAATDIRELTVHMEEQLIDLKYLMVEEDNIQKENQETVQSIRMVPANTIAARCQRIVRQACRATNKEAELEIKGADLLIDSEILNDMVEPLMHLLRNSIDHGIESAEIRAKLNKPKIGKITLEFNRKGNYAVITCKDDGAGLASADILQTAIKKGLVTPEQKLTEAEIHKLILIPGFSTRTVVTQTSGRGIGMDAIQTKVSAMQGQMTLQSFHGQGLTIEIIIPLTLSSMLSLLVKCSGQIMAISNRGLRKIHHAEECILITQDNQLYCEIEYQRYPAKYLAELLGMSVNNSTEQKFPALRLEDEIGRTYIVLVEELLGYRDLLVKNLGHYILHIQGITGATILGNGAVAPVIDLVELLHHVAKHSYKLPFAAQTLSDEIIGLPQALVVDDSLSARRSVAMLLEDSGLKVDTAIDGLDAIKHIEKSIPDLIIVDLEMPRMNGIELTAHVRGREDMKNTPIIMITSRATEKHRKQAEAAGVTKFMTKPFTEDDLVNTVRMLMN